ncbi:hypothetical protein [Arthrobacter roseus]|uniref:hypothetical protein n=1 Tax=Arthrobacter roseus TaxID=136274 RepID=UPI001963E884|nr:hypothetical protein [Arthrobacter roseus]MBM7849472.1 hypothetical protein [Arthrobacter roseus]
MNTTNSTKWLDSFTLELRLRDVPGVAIGDAVATVEEHCSDSGEDAQSAFGDAREYARSLDLPARHLRPREALRLAGFGLMSITGISLVLSAGPRALDGEAIPVLLSAVVLLAGFLLLFILVMARLDWLMRTSFWKASLTGGVAFSALVLLAVVLHDTVLWTVPALPLAIAGLALMLVPPLYGQFFDRSAEDGLIDPRREEGPQRRRDRVQYGLISWGFPIGVVLYLLLKWLITR